MICEWIRATPLTVCEPIIAKLAILILFGFDSSMIESAANSESVQLWTFLTQDKNLLLISKYAFYVL